MLFLGVSVFLVFKGPEGADDFGPSLSWFNDRVDIATLRGDERIGEQIAEFSYFFLT